MAEAPHAPGPVASDATVRVRIDLAYDGAPFRGFAANPGVRTVAGDLRQALGRIIGPVGPITGAGRTDAGVHARAQVVTLDLPREAFDPERLLSSLNRLLAPHIAVRRIQEAPPGFDARFSALSRTYRYHVHNDRVHDPLMHGKVWHVPQPLELAALRQACIPILGEHDFTSFCRRPPAAPDGSVPSLVRRVLRAEWRREGPLFRFEIEASSFCHQMVRSLVGAMVDVGRGRLRASDVVAILAARDRSAVPTVAPPHGLVLWAVRYPPEDDEAAPGR